MANVIEMKQVNRSFNANHVLRDLDCVIEEGTITGLLGVNGAGKTTMLHTFLGLIKPDSGTSLIYGEESWSASADVRQKLGFVPQQFDGFEWMTIRQILEYTGAFYENWQPRYVDDLVDTFELAPDERVSDLSVGMKQRVSIIMALGHGPELIVLDEPVAALDPVGRRTFIELLLDLHMSEGRTVVFSTHITSDIERVAARVAMMQQGNIVIHTDLEDLKQSYCRVHVHSQTSVEGLFDDVPGCLKKEISAKSARLTLHDMDESWCAGLQQRAGVQVEREDLNLDEIFLELNT